MNTLFTMKRRDLLPILELTLSDDGAAIDLTLATTVRLIVRGPAGIRVSAAMTVLDQSVLANRGKVTYAWQAGDVGTVGVYSAEVEVIWSNGKPQTYPAGDPERYFTVRIDPDLDNP